MTAITLNIKTGSENSEPNVTATPDNDKTVVPKSDSLKDESAKKDDSKKMGMTEEELQK